MFFRRKNQGEPETEKTPKIKEESVQFPGRFRSVCPEPQAESLATYFEPALQLSKMLSDLDAGEGGLQRIRWQLEIATEAMTMIGKRPLQAIIPLHAESVWDWHRAAYLRGLVAGIGNYLRAGAVITQSTKDLHPAIQGWPDVVMQYVPNRPIKQEFKVSQSIAEYRVAEQAGIIKFAQDLHPGVFGYFCDSFGADAWSRNPISISILEAEDKVARILNLDGFRTQNVARLSKTSDKISIAIDDEQFSGNLPVASPEAPKQDSLKARNMASEDAVAPGLLAGNHKAMIEFVCERLAQGVITINEHDSVFCQIHGRIAVVCPRGLSILAQMTGLDEGDLESVIGGMSDESMSTPRMEYRIQRKGRGWGKIRLLVLEDSYTKLLLDAATKVSSPPAIKSKPMEGQRGVTKA